MKWRNMLTATKAIADSWWSILLMAALMTGIVYQRWDYTHPAKPVVAHVGEKVPPLTLRTPAKKKVLLDWSADSKSTIVYVFTPTCVWCKRNLEAMRTVANSASAYHFIAVSLVEDGVEDYIKANHLSMPVYIAADKASRTKLGVHGTPTTLIISPKGVISQAWPGVYHGKIAEQVENTFKIKLPEIALK